MTGGLQAVPVELLTAGRVGAVLPGRNTGAVWYIHGFISCHVNVGADHDVRIFRFFFVFILSLKYGKSWDVGTAMKSIVLVGSLGASLGFDGLSNEMAGGVGVLVWRLWTNVFTFCSSVFSKLLSFFKRSRSSEKGISCCDVHLKKVNMVSSFCSSRDGLVTGRFVGRDGLVTWCFVGRALQWYVGVLRNTLDGSGVVRGVMWCAAWGLVSSWALGDACSISVRAVCSGEEGEICSG